MFFCAVLGTLMLSSCCQEQDENSGAIIEVFTFDNLDEYHYKRCLELPDTMCIRTDSVYKKTFSLSYYKPGCGQLSIPEVDFSINSILIFHKFEYGNLYFHRVVTIDTVGKVVTYEIHNTKCICLGTTCIRESYNVVLVPRIPEDYKIEYK